MWLGPRFLHAKHSAAKSVIGVHDSVCARVCVYLHLNPCVRARAVAGWEGRGHKQVHLLSSAPLH